MLNTTSIRLARIAVTPESFIRMRVGAKYEVTSTGVPQGAELRGVRFNEQSQQFEILLESEKLAVVLEGAVVPLIDGPEIKEITKQQESP